MCTDVRKGKKMKYSRMKKTIGAIVLATLLTGILGGCGKNQVSDSGNSNITNKNVTDSLTRQDNSSTTDNDTGNGKQTEYTELTVRFGDNAESFTLHLLKNDTAQAIAKYVGTSDWRLPIYDRDNSLDYSVMEYYDIPRRYNIPSDNPEIVTEVKAGDVYYSAPNRIVLFYQDAEISEEYTKIGTFDATDAFISAVKNNPVLEGWGNKIIQISRP